LRNISEHGDEGNCGDGGNAAEQADRSSWTFESSVELIVPLDVSVGKLLHSVEIDVVAIAESVVLGLRPEVVNTLICCAVSNGWTDGLELCCLEIGSADVDHLPTREACVKVSNKV